jgi:transketolase
MGVDGAGHWGRSEVDLIRYFNLREEAIMGEALRLLRGR